MAEIILSPVATVIIKTLGSAAVEKIGALYSVSDDLEDLKATLETIGAVLLDAERQQGHNNQVQLWLKRLADVVNDADDLVDGVNTVGLLRGLNSKPTWSKALKKVRVFFSSSNQLGFQIKLACEISGVRKRLNKIVKDRGEFTFVVSNERVERIIWRETQSSVDEDSVVGRDEDKRRVLELLFEKEVEEKVRVISIFGMGGLGKTTLAQIVFKEESVQKGFDEKIWVCVSEDFDVKVILRSIVKALDGASVKDGDSKEKLQKTLQEKLNGKRYFLVLDDVWNENQHLWLDLMAILSNCGDFGSRIVVTTRSEIVAELTSSVLQPCRLGILNDKDSWCLFKKIAFKHGRNWADGVEIEKKIVKKCGGIPLAIRMIASMLSNRDPETEWPAFLEKELSSLPQQQNDILPTLKLSYDSLPSHLKICFAYSRLFPKDYKIDVQTLINLWISQGFISVSSADDNQRVEDIGYNYFLELLGRCFFEEAKIDEVMNKVVACKMHDLVHDLAVQVVGKEYAVLFNPSHTENINENVRHVSLHSKLILGMLPRARKLRSVLFFGGFSLQDFFFKLNLKEVISNFRFIRTLDLNLMHIEKVPYSIGKLKHLRYLDLSRNGIKSLPTSITKLVNLHTLRLNDCYNLHELPRDMKKLVNLGHLEFFSKDHILTLPRGVGQLANLQTLSYLKLSESYIVASRSCKLDELMCLNNLRGNIDIVGLRARMETTCANLKAKEHLRDLGLKWSNLNIHSMLESNDEEREKTLEGLKPHLNIRKLIVDGYDGVRFSSWLTSLTNLVELRLKACSKLKQISLESLSCLTKMSISYCSELEYIIIDVDGDFRVLPSLKMLELKNLPNFKGWSTPNTTKKARRGFSTMYFPCITKLTMSELSKLTWMPLYPHVKELMLETTNRISFLMSIARLQTSAALTTSKEILSSKSLPSIFHPLSEVKIVRLYYRNKTETQYFPDWMQSLSSIETLEIFESPLSQYGLKIDQKIMEWELRGDADEQLILIKGNQVKWEIFSSIRKLRLMGVPASEYLSGPIQYATSLEELRIDSSEEKQLDVCETNSIRNFEALTSLHTLEFIRLRNLVSLPEWLQHIATLQILKVSYCDNLRGIPDWICNLSSLQELHIDALFKLESLPRLMSSLKCLHTLHISSFCISIEGLGDLTSLQTLKLRCLPALVTLPDALQRATMLQTLDIQGCDNLAYLPDWIYRISSLRMLSIVSCNIKSLPRSTSNLACLHTLKIGSCPISAEGLGDPIKWGALTSLQTLQLWDLPKLITLPEGLQCSTTLQNLDIQGCDNLTDLPDWICIISSLRELQIVKCPKIESLPVSISSLTSLQELIINNCPVLETRYKRETGKDWSKIKHIPIVRIQALESLNI